MQLRPDRLASSAPAGKGMAFSGAIFLAVVPEARRYYAVLEHDEAARAGASADAGHPGAPTRGLTWRRS